jgi:hypothetical protein
MIRNLYKILVRKGRDYLGVLHVDGRIILKWTLKKQDKKGFDCIHLAQHRDQ